MSEDLDLRGIDQRHEPGEQFRVALQARVASIVAGLDPGSVTDTLDAETIELDHGTAKPEPRRIRRRAAAAILAAAAGVAAIAVLATRDYDPSPADQASPTETPQPLSDHFGVLDPGTYFVDKVGGISTPRISATLGAGWTKSGNPAPEGWQIAKRDDIRTFDEMRVDLSSDDSSAAFDEYLQHDVGVMEISHPIAVYSDACHWQRGNHPGPLDTVDSLVAALVEQQGWAEVTAPSDISIDGYAGKAFQRTAPVDMSDCTSRAYGTRTSDGATVNPDFRSWENPGEPGGWAGLYYEPGWIETLWVLNLDGTMVVITTGVFPEPSAGADATFADDVLDSIRITSGSEEPIDTIPGLETIDSGANNPLELIDENLTVGAEVALFRVNSDQPAYWRLTTLPQFDGRTWRLPRRTLSPVDDTTDSEPGGRSVRQNVQILELEGRLLPVAAEPVAVTPSTGIRFNGDTGTLLKTTDLEEGDQFTIVSAAPDVTLERLRGATTDSPPDELFLELPDDLPDSLADLAAEVTAGATTDADKMIALQNWFQSEFEYDVTVPASDDDTLERFLQERRGFCAHFSSTFAAMARTLGIPSRVAVGFTTGELGADGWYRVTGRNSHSWPEVWFDGIGWIPFEPTPQRGIPGAEDYTGIAAEQQAGP